MGVFILQNRGVSGTIPGSLGDSSPRHLERLRREVFTRLSERRWIPDTLARKVMVRASGGAEGSEENLGGGDGPYVNFQIKGKEHI